MTTLLAGWLGGVEALVRFSPTFQAIVPTTALCFFILTVALIGIGLGSKKADAMARRATMLVAAIAVVNMVVRVTIHADGLDVLLPFWTDLGDRMSYATAFLLLLASGLIFLSAIPRHEPPIILLGGALMGLTTVGGIAKLHGLDVNSFYRLKICDGMSFYTLLLFGLVFSALIVIHLTVSPAGEPDGLDH